MKASLRSARIAPKKANIIARMVRGMSVPAAVEALRCTNKKAARLVEDLLRSAMANASHNDKQDPQTMVIKTIVVNQGTAYRRGMPKARGQTRPFRKFLSHIEVELGYPEEGERKLRKPKNSKKPTRVSDVSKGAKKASQKGKSPVQKISVKKATEDSSSASSVSSVSSK